jgi:hypothetical protein
MHKPLCLVGLIALAGCNGAPPAPTPSAATAPGESDGRAYTLLVPNMT